MKHLGYSSIKVDSLSHEGRGVARIDNKTIFLENALPDEIVNCVCTKKRSKFNIGKAVEIISSSSDRASPVCEHYDVCGGCSLQHLKHQKQVSFKQKIMQEHLEHIGGLKSYKILPPILGPTIEYRSRARLGVKYVFKKEKVLVGFREKSGSYIVDTKECPVLHSSVGKKIDLLSELVAKLSIYKYIPQIEVACTDKVTALVFRNLQDFSESDTNLLIKFGKQHDLEIYTQAGGLDTVKKIYPENTLSLLNYELSKYNLEINFTPTDFTQINHLINLQLVDLAIQLLDLQPTDRVLDLFCGIGNFTLPIATICKKAIGVEGSKSAVLRAHDNAKHNDIKNTEFYAFDLTKELPAISWAKQQYDKILLDPPRSGAEDICRQINRFDARKIVYVSCNPLTFARDAKILVGCGYKLENVAFADMYPHTSHLEMIGCFSFA